MNKTIKRSKGWSITLALATFIYIWTSSIAFPILCKPFYYVQIDSLRIEERSGLSREQIKTSYSEVVDYCIGARTDFAVGGLHYSESGKQHFVDCRKLFILNLSLLAVSIATITICLIIHRIKGTSCVLLRGHGPGFWSGLMALITFAIIAILGSINFDKTFVVFHNIFFPGKTNWILDYKTDEIIKIFPEDFFMHCAIIIVVLVLIQSLAYYEMLETIQNELEANDIDLKKYNLDVNLEKKYI